MRNKDLVSLDIMSKADLYLKPYLYCSSVELCVLHIQPIKKNGSILDPGMCNIL